MTTLTSTGTAVASVGARGEVETLLLNRCAGVMEVADMDYTTASGSNADLNDPIAFAVRRTEGTVTDPTNVSDADVSSVESTRFDEMVDIAEWRLLTNIWGNYTLIDFKLGPRQEKNDQIRLGLQRRIEKTEKTLQDVYGFASAEGETGVISLDFAEHDD